MNSSSSRRVRFAAAAALAIAGAFALAPLPAAAQEAVRPEIGRPLQQAQEMIKSGRYRDALAKVRDAEAAGPRNDNERTLIERMRMAAASGAGDADQAAKSFEALSSRLSGPEKLRMVESIAGSYYRAQQYAKAMQWGQRYVREGGSSPAMRTMLIQSQYLSGDFAGAARELRAEIDAAEKAGQAPAEARLQLLLTAANKQNDNNAYVYAMEKLVTYYPKKEYWVDLLSRMQRKSTFSGRLALDAYRLSLATGSMSATNDYMEMAQLALQAGQPSEAKQVLEKGYAAKALGVGNDAARHGRLRDLIDKRLAEAQAARPQAEKDALAAKGGEDLVQLGTDLVWAGQAAKGVKFIQDGIAKGVKRPDDAKLQLGIAQLKAGDKAKAQQTFRTVQGADGTADLARLWSLYARRGS